MPEPKFYIVDERDVWHSAISDAAREFGFDPHRIKSAKEVTGPGFGFMRCHAKPARLRINQSDYDQMARGLVMIQDRDQVMMYENKSAQAKAYADWMPETWRFTDRKSAVEFIQTCALPIVSKADVGASSVNVRVIDDRKKLYEHVSQLFSSGIRVSHCSGGDHSIQRGYILLQEFIPHEITYRVNIIGSGRAIFHRFNYPNRPVAQTGNVAPVMEMSEEVERLLDFADRFAEAAKTKWCALDILKSDTGWRLIETSLAWPWPSPGDCNSAPIFRTNYKWIDIFRCMFSELLKGEFGGLDTVM
jgi:glutathione synthase/RimK-type ligase-like ATP-grasp enzyme